MRAFAILLTGLTAGGAAGFAQPVAPAPNVMLAQGMAGRDAPAAGASVATAAPVMVRSGRPETVSVTVYREPDRNGGGLNLNALGGYALITETRTIDLPAGPATVRFEGVAEGMVAVSAVVTGLPGGVVQKNRDANLLSPASLLDGTLGNRVTVRRTSPVTGAVREEQAIVRSGADGAVVLQMAGGAEALRCSGLPESLVYSSLPRGLVPVPVLSVDTVSDTARRAQVTLTYLATGFDWAADYVVNVGDTDETIDLFAWLTVANANGERFPDAAMQAVAGRLEQASDYRSLVDSPRAPRLNLRCWPMGSGRDGIQRPIFKNQERDFAYLPPPAPAPPVARAPMEAEEVTVTGSRIAQQEDLGDLKLYRVPMRVDISANAQKQVALLARSAVAAQWIGVARVFAGSTQGPQVLTRTLRLNNRAENGLGVPLPAGRVAIYREHGDRRLLEGRGTITDRAIGEEVDIAVGAASALTLESVETNPKRGAMTLTLRNASAVSRVVEVRIGESDAARIVRPSVPLPQRNGTRTWTVTVPANGEATLRYRVRRPRPE